MRIRLIIDCTGHTRHDADWMMRRRDYAMFMLDGGSCAAAYDYYRRDVCVADSFLLHTLHTLRDAPQRVNQTRDANAKPHCSCTHAHTQTPYTQNIQPCTRHTHTHLYLFAFAALSLNSQILNYSRKRSLLHANKFKNTRLDTRQHWTRPLLPEWNDSDFGRFNSIR